MCLIIVKKAGAELNKELLKSAINKSGVHNNHGFGFTLKTAKSKRIFINKGQKTTKELIEDLEEMKINKEDELIVHLRYGTAGKQNEINCHPFVVSLNTEEVEQTYDYTYEPVLAHNGVISEFTDRTSNYSDTFHFVRDYFALIDPKHHQKLLNSVGANRFALSYPGKREMLLGGSGWNEDKGLWFSNTGYKDYSSYSSSNPTGVGTTHGSANRGYLGTSDYECYC